MELAVGGTHDTLHAPVIELPRSVRARGLAHLHRSTLALLRRDLQTPPKHQL